MSTPTILRRILARKHEEVAERSRARPLPELRAALADAPPCAVSPTRWRVASRAGPTR